MSRLLRGRALSLCLILILLTLPVMAQVSHPNNDNAVNSPADAAGQSAQPLPVLSLQPCIMALRGATRTPARLWAL